MIQEKTKYSTSSFKKGKPKWKSTMDGKTRRGEHIVALRTKKRTRTRSKNSRKEKYNMNLEFRHGIKGLWGYYETSEHCWCFDDDVVNKALREFRKDKSSVLWVMDVSVEANHRNIIHVSMAWETWEDYDNKEVTMTFWRDFNDREYHKFSWEKAKRIFRKVIGEAVKGDVVMSDIVKPQKAFE